MSIAVAQLFPELVRNISAEISFQQLPGLCQYQSRRDGTIDAHQTGFSEFVVAVALCGGREPDRAVDKRAHCSFLHRILPNFAFWSVLLKPFLGFRFRSEKLDPIRVFDSSGVLIAEVDEDRAPPLATFNFVLPSNALGIVALKPFVRSRTGCK